MSSLRVESLRFLRWGPIDLEVATGECVTMSGPSGAGKTLLLRAIADLDQSEGRVFRDEVERMTIAAPEWRRSVGFLPAESAWWEDRVGPHFNRIDTQTLEELGFSTDVVDWQISRLSSGERQRLALARLLAIDPAFLLLDEPTANLDEANTARVEAIVARYRSQTSAGVLWVTHDPPQAARVGGAHLRFVDGRLISGREEPLGSATP